MKFLKQATYVRYVLVKLIKICSSQRIDLLRFHFTEDSLKIEKGLEIVSTFFTEFFDKDFSFVILHKLVKFHHQIVFTFQVIR